MPRRPLSWSASVTARCGALGLALLLPGCPADPADLEAVPAALGPMAAGDYLVQADPSTGSLVVIASELGRLEHIRRIDLDADPSLVVPVPGQSAALVLSRADETLDVVSLDGADRRKLVLGAPFEAVTVSSDARAAIAYFPPGSATTVFYNDNEIAQIDLAPEVDPEDAVTRRTLASLGGAPSHVALSPEVAGRRYAFVLSQEHVAIVNLDDPDMVERSVPLVSLTTGGQRTPTGVEFAVDRATGQDALWALVTTAEASSVYALEITPTELPVTPGEADFDVRLSQLSGIGPGGTATLVTLADGRLASLATAPATGRITLTDLATATGEAAALSGKVSQLRLFEAPSEDGGEPTLQALVWTPGDSKFHVVDVEALAAGDDKSFRTRTTREPFATVLPVPDTTLFVLFHGTADKGVSVLDAETDRVTSFGRTGAVRQTILSEELGRLFLLTRFGGDDFVVSVDLETLHPETALVPDGADGIALLSGVQTLAAFSSAIEGHVVLWPAGDTRTVAAQAVPGFLLEGLFQRAEASK